MWTVTDCTIVKPVCFMSRQHHHLHYLKIAQVFRVYFFNLSAFLIESWILIATINKSEADCKTGIDSVNKRVFLTSPKIIQLVFDWTIIHKYDSAWKQKTRLKLFFYFKFWDILVHSVCIHLTFQAPRSNIASSMKKKIQQFFTQSNIFFVSQTSLNLDWVCGKMLVIWVQYLKPGFMT